MTPILNSDADLSYRDASIPRYLSADQSMRAVDLGKEWFKIQELTGRDIIPNYYGVPTGTKSQTVTWSVPKSRLRR